MIINLKKSMRSVPVVVVAVVSSFTLLTACEAPPKKSAYTAEENSRLGYGSIPLENNTAHGQ